MLHKFETGAIASKNNNSLHTFIAINIEHGPVHRILLYLGWQTISWQKVNGGQSAANDQFL